MNPKVKNSPNGLNVIHGVSPKARLLQAANEEVLQDTALHTPEEVSATVLAGDVGDTTATTPGPPNLPENLLIQEL
jgi:hypothetical protein